MAEVARDETTTLIASGKVKGSSLYNIKGEKVGSVQDLMIDKASGKIDYAVIAFGGMFGLGSDYYPLPWPALQYDVGLGGYVTKIEAPQLEGAPSFGEADKPLWGDNYETRMREYYNDEKFSGLIPYPNSL